MDALLLGFVKLYSIVIFITIFFDLKMGMILYLSYFFLIPQVTLGFFPVTVLSLALFGVASYKYKRMLFSPQSFWAIAPYAFLLLMLGLFIPLSPTPISFQFEKWRVDFINGLLTMWVVCLMVINDGMTKTLVRFFLIISFIVGIYALILTQTEGVNPYVFGFSILSDGKLLENWFADSNRLFGRISSTFIHPMIWAFVCGALIIVCFAIRDKISKFTFFLLMIVLSLDMLFCGVRSVLAAFLVTVVFYLLLKRQIKLLLYSGLTCLLILLLITTNDLLFSYVSSIFDFSGDASVSQGSSFEMRFNQLGAALKEMKDSPFIGKGYNWHQYYMETEGDHPELLAFESLIFTILCNSGLLGVIIWVSYVLMLLFIPKFILKDKDDIIILQCLTCYYFVYSIITGDFGVRFFCWFYAILFGMSYHKIKLDSKLSVLKKIFIMKKTKMI